MMRRLALRTETRASRRTKLWLWSAELAAALWTAARCIGRRRRASGEVWLLDLWATIISAARRGRASRCAAVLRRRALRATTTLTALPTRSAGATSTLTSGTPTALTALTTGAKTALAGSVRLPLRAIGLHGTGFLHSQFAVVVLVERQERFGGIGQLFFVYLAVLIGIQRGDDRRDHHRTSPGLAGPPRRAIRPALFWFARLRSRGRFRRRRRGTLWSSGILSEQGSGSGQKSEQ